MVKEGGKSNHIKIAVKKNLINKRTEKHLVNHKD